VPYDVTVEFVHEGLAETHHLAVRFALGVEIRPTLGPTHRQAGQAVLEHLFESQELEDAQIHAGVKAQPPFVGADRVAVLDPVTLVDLDAAVVVFPGHAENDHAVRFGHALGQVVALVLFVLVDPRYDVVGPFGDRLLELFLPAVAAPHAVHEAGNRQ
jgi:hypothetical protein